MKILALLVRFPSFITCVCLIGCAAQSFAADTDRSKTAVGPREGVTISGGDGSSYDKAIVVPIRRKPELPIRVPPDLEKLRLLPTESFLSDPSDELIADDDCQR